MNKFINHLSKNIIAGIVAILPIGGIIITVGFLESSISSSGINKLPFYFPGLGILITVLVVYLLGLATTNMLGNIVWNKIDRIIHSMPALGKLYGTVKQILGYGEGEDAIFLESVLVKTGNNAYEEFGLVTNKFKDVDGSHKLVVFIPGAPNPSNGRLVIVSSTEVKVIKSTTNETFKSLVAVGKSNLNIETE